MKKSPTSDNELFIQKMFQVGAKVSLLFGSGSVVFDEDLLTKIVGITLFGGLGVWLSLCDKTIRVGRFFDKTTLRETAGYAGRNYIATSLLFCVGTKLPSRNVRINSAILGGLGLGILALWKRLSIDELFYTIGTHALVCSMISMLSALREKNGDQKQDLKIIGLCCVGIAGACLSQDDVSWFGRKVGLNICDQHKKFEKFSYLPNEWVNYWKDRDIDDGDKKVSIKREVLQQLYEEAEANRLRRTPFILRSFYEIKNVIFGKKQTAVARALEEQKKLQKSAYNALIDYNVPDEVCTRIFTYCAKKDARFEIDNKKQKLVVSNAVLRSEIVPYLQSDDWYIKNKSTLNIKLNNHIKPVSTSVLGFV